MSHLFPEATSLLRSAAASVSDFVLGLQIPMSCMVLLIDLKHPCSQCIPVNCLLLVEAELRAPCVEFDYQKSLPSRIRCHFYLQCNPAARMIMTRQVRQADEEHTCGDNPGCIQLPGNGEAGALCRLPKRAVLLATHEQWNVLSP